MRKCTCPYCSHKFPNYEVIFRCDNCKDDNGVQGRLIENKLNYEVDGFPFVAKNFMPEALECPVCHNITTHRLCPYCKEELKDDVLAAKNKIISIAVVGSYKSGKSNYVGTLIHELQSFVIRDVMKGNCLVSNPKVQNIYDNFYQKPLYEQHSSLSGKEKVTMLSYDLRWGEREMKQVHLNFYDVGMDALLSNESNLDFLKSIDGIIIMIDPVQMQSIWNQIPIEKREASCPGITPSQRTQQEMAIGLLANGIRGKKRGKIAIPAAVVCSKLDALDEFLPEGSLISEESSVLQNGVYHQKEAEQLSGEVRNLIYSWREESIVNTLDMNFSHLAYFGVSALGHVPYPGEKFPPTPVRVEEPFLWILRQKGVI